MSSSPYFHDTLNQWRRLRSYDQYQEEGGMDSSMATREKILMAAFDEIYQRGFQAASLNNILKNTNITKGALYHHFKNKLELGYAVVDEVIHSTFKDNWIEPLSHSDDPVGAIQDILLKAGEQMTEDDVRLGCPLNNLAQEMSPIDEGFRMRITAIYEEWRDALKGACERAKAKGRLRQDVDSKQLALLFIATLEGCVGFAKSAQSLEILLQCGHGLITQLELLKVDNDLNTNFCPETKTKKAFKT